MTRFIVLCQAFVPIPWSMVGYRGIAGNRAHNGVVAGSSPAGPTILLRATRFAGFAPSLLAQQDALRSLGVGGLPKCATFISCKSESVIGQRYVGITSDLKQRLADHDARGFRRTSLVPYCLAKPPPSNRVRGRVSSRGRWARIYCWRRAGGAAAERKILIAKRTGRNWTALSHGQGGWYAIEIMGGHQGLSALARWLRTHLPQKCRRSVRNHDARHLGNSRQAAVRA
jgi:hypothetical protein